MFRRLLPIIKLVVPAVLVLAAIDLLVFRSGFYYQWAERKSTVGAVMTAHDWALHQVRPGMKNILVLGDSRIGQGFSPAIANATAKPGINYVGVAVPGSSPRVWYYFLRSVDPDGRLFSAVVLMADSVRDDVLLEDFPDRGIDLNYLVPLLQVRDLGKLPQSFQNSELRERARLAILFPAVSMQEDIRGFLLHPRARIDDLRRWFAIRWESVSHYPGIPDRLPELSPTLVNGLPIDLAGMRPGLQQKMRGYFQTLRLAPSPDRIAALNGYRNLWIGGIAARYQDHGVPVILFQIPRGPYHGALVPVRPADGAYAQMAKAGRIKLLPPGEFIDLEQPKYFFDHLHLNSAGRKEFSTRLPAALTPFIP